MQYPDIICGNCGTPNPFGTQQCRKCGMVLVSPQQYHQTQYYSPNPYPVQNAVESGTNWAKVLTLIIGGLIVVVLCLGLAGIAFYMFDPLGMFVATPTAMPTVAVSPSSPAVENTPAVPPTRQPPTTAPLPSETIPPPPPATEYPTYTPYPTFTQPVIPTTAVPPSITPTTQEFKFIDPAVSSSQVKYGGCAPSSVDFSVKVSSRDNVVAIVLFTRLMDSATQNYLTGWTSGVSMKYKSDNKYEINQSGNTLSQGQTLDSAIVVYQFVNQTKKGDYIRSANYKNLTLLKCP